MEQTDFAEIIRQAIAPYADVTTAHIASGIHSAHPLEAGRGKGPARILAAACSEFFRVGYYGASTRDVAAAAGMSATALYAHYPSKESMLFKLCVLGTGSALETLRKAAKPETPPLQRLRSSVYAFAYWHAENHVLARVAQWNLAALEPDSFEVIASLRREIDYVMRSILVDGVETGEFVVSNLTGATLAILSLCIDIVRWYPSRKFHAPEEIASAYVANVEAMVLPTPRRSRSPQRKNERPLRKSRPLA
jgi:AcrR family transcriptional regulator